MDGERKRLIEMMGFDEAWLYAQLGGELPRSHRHWLAQAFKSASAGRWESSPRARGSGARSPQQPERRGDDFRAVTAKPKADEAWQRRNDRARQAGEQPEQP
jgi:hypothetical protein